MLAIHALRAWHATTYMREDELIEMKISKKDMNVSLR
jgi:hypothetical protein